MLELRPNCECCDRDLPPESDLARICTFECTFCADCVDSRFDGRCPNCGGDFTRRPIRPAALLGKYPASRERVLKPHPECAPTGSTAARGAEQKQRLGRGSRGPADRP